MNGELAIELAAVRFHVRRASATALGFEDSARFHAEGEGPLPAFLTRWSGPLKRPSPERRAAAEDYTTTIELERWPLVATSRNG